MEEGRINRREAAALLGVTPQSVANLAARGVLSVEKVGRWHYFSRAEVLSLIPKTESVREAEKGISEVTADLERERASRVTEAMMFRARREFIERMTDVSTFNRYAELVEALYYSVERSLALDEQLTERELAVLRDIVRLRPVGELATHFGLTENRVRQIFERALRRMKHYSNRVAGTMDSLRGENARLYADNARLAAENKKMKDIIGDVRIADRTADSRVLSARVRDLDLSVRAINCLVAADIETVFDLVKTWRGDMVRFRNLGKKSLAEIERWLSERGLHLGMTEFELLDYIDQ